MDFWKKQLLDLGKRNHLLNYRDTSRSNLKVTKPGIFELWDSFVVKEQPLEFPCMSDEQSGPEKTAEPYSEEEGTPVEPDV